jgi:hypothetical protein
MDLNAAVNPLRDERHPENVIEAIAVQRVLTSSCLFVPRGPVHAFLKRSFALISLN